MHTRPAVSVLVPPSPLLHSSLLSTWAFQLVQHPLQLNVLRTARYTVYTLARCSPVGMEEPVRALGSLPPLVIGSCPDRPAEVAFCNSSYSRANLRNYILYLPLDPSWLVWRHHLPGAVRNRPAFLSARPQLDLICSIYAATSPLHRLSKYSQCCVDSIVSVFKHQS